MTTIIYGDKFIVYRSDARDAMKASMEIDSISYAHIDVHESVITVNVTAESSNKYAKEREIFSNVEKVLTKYGIDYKYKRIVF